MPVPTSDVHIANLALDRLGIAPVTNIVTPSNTTEDIVARHYIPTRRELLRKYIFNFAKKYAVLTEDSTKTPAFGFSTAFALPNDFIRLCALGDVTINGDVPPNLYDLSEGYIFTDSAEAGDLNIQYVFDATTVAKYDPLFIQLFKLQLAANMAYKFTLKPSLIQGIIEELRDVAAAAAAIAGQEKPPRRLSRSKWATARQRGNSSLRDNRFI